MRWAVAGAVVGSLLVLCASYLAVRLPSGVTGEHELIATEGELSFLSVCVVEKAALQRDRPLAFPAGGIGSLYRWMEADDGRPKGLLAQIPERWKDRNRRVFVDAWGNPLVYGFPSARKERMFDLYSVGLNGIDEKGSGDDISDRGRAEFSLHRDLFAAGEIDVDWVRSHFGALRRNAEGKIIGVPSGKGS